MKTPIGMDTDHINGDGLDNRRINLRICTHAENLRNKRIYYKNISGVSGVTWDRDSNKWRARVGLNGIETYLGTFHKKSTAIEKVTNFRKSLTLTA